MTDGPRIVVAGAEKLAPAVRDAFKLKFNKDIYEGYGATETTSVASVNVPDELDVGSWKVQRGTKAGTVGMPLPGTSFRIVDPDTLATLPPNGKVRTKFVYSSMSMPSPLRVRSTKPASMSWPMASA